MKIAILILGLLVSVGTHAGKRIESCESAALVPDRGWVYKKVPCSSFDRLIPCTKDWTDEKGHWHSEIIECPPNAKQKTFEQVERDEEAAKEKACGKDYGELRVGMTIKRFEQCNEAVTFETETISKDGSIKLYSSTFWWIRVKSGRIVSYTRRTF